MKKIAFYAGSFDPFTIGHFRIVCEALCSYDKVIIGIGNNPGKATHMFGAAERKTLIQYSLLEFLGLWQNKKFCKSFFSKSENKALKRLQDEYECLDIVFYNDLTVDAALQHGATSLIRGKRIVGDDADEMYQSIINKQLLAVRQRYLSMDLIPVPQENLTYVSSSAFKNLCAFGEYVAAMAYVSPSVHNAMMAKCLKPVFLSAYRGTVLGYFEGQPEEAWQKLLKAYEKRSYHNLSHLAYGINYFNIYRRLSGEVQGITPEEFLFAWFYHDIVCGEQNAEEKSAQIVSDFFYNGKNIVPNLVLATKHQKYVLKTEAEKLISDIDLAILGDVENYEKYSLGLRNEYRDIDDAAYAAGRSKFLQKQLKSDVFHLPFFKEMLEDTARHNMQRELQIWQPLCK